MPTLVAPRPEPAAWALVWSAVPAATPVYQPSWLPARFKGAAVYVDLGHDQGRQRPAYQVSYRTKDREMIAFLLGPGVGAMGNATPPATREPIPVHGAEGQLFTSAGSPRVWATWQERGQTYSVRAFGERTTRDELLQIIEGLAPVATPGP
ncbi:MAG: hypothetical protein ACRDI2_23955 [Chloroflexota bacterium]